MPRGTLRQVTAGKVNHIPPSSFSFIVSSGVLLDEFSQKPRVSGSLSNRNLQESEANGSIKTDSNVFRLKLHEFGYCDDLSSTYSAHNCHLLLASQSISFVVETAPMMLDFDFNKRLVWLLYLKATPRWNDYRDAVKVLLKIVRRG